MGEDVAAAGFIDVEADHLLADRTLGGDRVKPPPAQQLYEFHNPYRDVPHVPPPEAQTRKYLHLNEIMTALLGRRSARPGAGLRSVL